MHTALVYELQKAVKEQRLGNVAHAQQAQPVRGHRRPRLLTAIRVPAWRRFRIIAGLLGFGPGKNVKSTGVYPMTGPRKFDEVAHVVDSLQLTANPKAPTRVNGWQSEEEVTAGSGPDEQANEPFGESQQAKRYIGIVREPRVGMTAAELKRSIASER